MKKYLQDEINTTTKECEYEIESPENKNKYENLEKHLTELFGECDGILESIVEGFIKYYLSHESAGEKKFKTTLLTNETAYEWDEYKKKRDQGLLLQMPCKVGDTVYILSNGKVEECSVMNVKFISDHNAPKEEQGFFIYAGSKIFRTFHEREIGKIVFMSKAEAEKKLISLK